ncbi:hypothetical protein P280DRAFT_472233 [Massarina eburnea CBS 473.64]|uniref:Uncharacterized protein n=1 Tax=Massarina eburnea CBS 473.64 TaxID=1395130 RepID=A0A6A6RQ58_9PLEO|nr:hypothetical protein P280DRAFT_472233 [Massarina eburnea CBS 473.64]
MSNLQFSNSEIRFATAAAAAIAALVPAFYLLQRSASVPQESSPHLKTFRKYLRAYSTLRPAALTTTATSHFTHAVLPLSLSIPARSLENFQQHANIIFSLFSSFQMIPVTSEGNDGVHFSKETNTVVAHCRMGGKVNGESEKGKLLIEAGYEEWWTENVLVVRMSKDGKRVEEVREFVDSAKAAELQKRLSGVLSN